MKYFLYRHIRLDKNEPFYIGIGTQPKYLTKNSLFARAYDINDRNKIWHNIVNISKYEVEILLESDNYEFIKSKEIEFIKLYGRKDLKTGTLCNLTEGGDGNTGYIASEETRRKISQNNYIKGKFGKLHPRAKKVYQYDLNGNFIKEWSSLHCIKREMGFTPDNSLRNKNKSEKGYMWFYNYKGNKIDSYQKYNGIVQKEKLSVSCYQYNLNGKFIKKWNTLKDVERELNIKTSRLSEVIKGRKFYKDTGFWFPEYMGEYINPVNYPNTKGKRNDL